MKDLIKSEKIELDKNGNCIHYVDSFEYECWKEYNENNNLIYSKNNNGCEKWFKYDKNNVLIYSKRIWEGMVVEYERSNYNGLMNKIHWTGHYESEFWQEWYDDCRLMHLSNSTGDLDNWFQYDDKRKFTEISKEEFEQIKRVKTEQEFLSRTEIPRSELIDI